ncbi:MAG: hypothetical protein FGM54_05275 [Chitinophagaceae bacterium]|nr:hypothetical protein [Chitinophagaceae bacterium]
MKKAPNIVGFLLFFLTTYHLQGQSKEDYSNLLPHDDDTLETRLYGLFPKQAKEALRSLQIGGYYRFVSNVRKLHEGISKK